MLPTPASARKVQTDDARIRPRSENNVRRWNPIDPVRIRKVLPGEALFGDLTSLNLFWYSILDIEQKNILVHIHTILC